MKTKSLATLIAAAIFLLEVVISPAHAADHQPYAGLEERPIKALAQEVVTELLEGFGSEYTLAAELNHYPGPHHVLQLGDPLELTARQKRAIEDLFESMQDQAKKTAERFVHLERQLDQAFQTGRITPATLQEFVTESAAVEGELRFVHLRPHLEVRSLLTANQIRRYDMLRGYAERPASHVSDEKVAMHASSETEETHPPDEATDGHRHGDGSNPHVGLHQRRTIKALSQERMDDLLAGRGAGFALAAELNHYPGPRHLLEFADEIQLTADQEGAVRSSFETMQAEAKRLGETLIDLESQLDRAFAGGTITEDQLRGLIKETAAVTGRLRYVHLATHLEVRPLLTEDQVAHYDRLRGYADPSGNMDHSHQHGGM